MMTGRPEGSSSGGGGDRRARVAHSAPAPLAGSTVTLRVPATPAFTAVARLTASGLAMRHGLDHQGVTDLRTAIDRALEAIGPLLPPPGSDPAGAGTGLLRLTFVLSARSVDVALAAEGTSLPEAVLSRLIDAVGGLVDGISRVGAESDTGAGVALVKHLY